MLQLKKRCKKAEGESGMIKIPEQYFVYFKKAGTVKRYQKKEIIYFQNDSADSLYLILKGRVRIFNSSASGKETTLEIVEKGRIFGESSFLRGQTRPTTVEAVNSVELVSCSIRKLLPFLQESDELLILMFQHLSQTCDYLSRQIYRLTNYDRYQRTASFLLEQTRQSNPDKNISSNAIPYTHEEIGGMLGLNRVTVSKVLAVFAKRGLIRNAYRRIVILDREGMKEIEKNSIPEERAPSALQKNSDCS